MPSRDEMLHKVTRADATRHKQRIMLATGILAVLVAVIATSILVIGDGPTSTRPITEAGESGVAETSPSSSQSSPCRNSHNDECGEFRWEPSPADDKPIQVNIQHSPTSPNAGDVVTFSMRVSDDSQDKPSITEADWGDGSVTSGVGGCKVQSERFGPWTPPSNEVNSNEVQVRHRYIKAGSYNVSFAVSTDQCDSRRYNPYGSRTTVKTMIVVGA